MTTRHIKLSDNKPTGYCFWCGKELNKKGKKYCSSKWEQNGGTLNKLHTGDTCQEKYYRKHYSNEVFRWIYESRNKECEICGIKLRYKEKRLHHKIPLADNGELLNPENIILFCHEHHVEAHRLYRLFKKIHWLINISQL